MRKLTQDVVCSGKTHLSGNLLSAHPKGCIEDEVVEKSIDGIPLSATRPNESDTDSLPEKSFDLLVYCRENSLVEYYPFSLS